MTLIGIYILNERSPYVKQLYSLGFQDSHTSYPQKNRALPGLEFRHRQQVFD